MSKDIIKCFEDRDRVNEISNSEHYIKFEIAECTEEALQKKCEHILKCQSIQWKPLKLERLSIIRMYIMTYYIERGW